MPRPRLCFSVVSELLRGQQFSFDGDQPITIGRTSDNMLALDHKSVSRRHARIEADGDGYVIIDLGSHNGTRVGDKLVSKHRLTSGDVIGLGEIQVKFTLVDDSAAPQGAAGVNLPAVATAAAQAAALGRPLTFEDVFGQAGPTEPIEVSKPRRNLWPVVYTVVMILIVVLGLTAFWAVGQRPLGPPKIDVLVRAGESLPVDLSRLPAPDRKGWIRGLSRVVEIGPPSDQRVADARRTRFRTFVSVRGKTLGTTDIPVYGPPHNQVIIRVLVRDVKPPSPMSDAENWPVDKRRAFAHKILEKARLFIRVASVNDQTWRVAQELDLAARLLEPIPGEMANANWASQTARNLREALDKRYTELARDIDVLREQGKYTEALTKALELKNLFPDPETEEHHITNMFYDSLAEEAARAEREAQEKR